MRITVRWLQPWHILPDYPEVEESLIINRRQGVSGETLNQAGDYFLVQGDDGRKAIYYGGELSEEGKGVSILGAPKTKNEIKDLVQEIKRRGRPRREI